MKDYRTMAGLVLLALVVANGAVAEEWTRFRGPNGSGVAEDGAYPAELNPQTNLLWRAAPRPGKSSPVLTERRIFLTSFDGEKLYTQCFDRRTGELLWERAEDRNREADLNQLNEPASMTPVTDGENVYVFFRDLGVVAYSAEGELLWKTPLGPFENSMGVSSSPILAEGLLIVEADQIRGSYIAALDPANGEIVWKTSREEGEGWATPLIYEGSGDEAQIVTISRGWIGAHRLSDGGRLWGRNAIPPAIVASPVVDDGVIYVFGYGNEPTSDFEGSFDRRDADSDGVLGPQEYGSHAFMVGIAKYKGDRDGLMTKEEWLTAAAATVAPSSLVAFRFGDDGGEPRELWRYERSFIGVIPSALVYRGVVYLIKNGGILETLDAETGEVQKRGRVREAVEGYSASPVAADGKVYLASEGGKVVVLRANADWEVISTNDLEEEIFATPALSQGQIFVRTSKTLYCFGLAQ